MRIREWTMMEILNPNVNAKNARVALFDFDGTLSLIRTGWVDVMVPMMVEFLLELNTGESEEQLYQLVREKVAETTGKQTIYQMIELANMIRERGGTPKDPLEYKKIYLERLHEKIKGRIQELRDGVDPEKYLVPGARQLLEALKERGLTMYLASGTDQDYMREEARLLRIYDYFDGGVYGALDDYKKFSKKILIENIIRQTGYTGDKILGFGDGFVEIQNVKEVGGTAVGAATKEPECEQIDEWKRQRLVRVGADVIVPNYKQLDELLNVLFPED